MQVRSNPLSWYIRKIADVRLFLVPGMACMMQVPAAQIINAAARSLRLFNGVDVREIHCSGRDAPSLTLYSYRCLRRRLPM